MPVNYIAQRTVSRGTFKRNKKNLYLRDIHVCIDFVCICVQLTINGFKTEIVSESSNRQGVTGWEKCGTSDRSAACRGAGLRWGVGGRFGVFRNNRNPHMDLKAYMKSYIPLETVTIYFLVNLFLNRVIARRMSWLILFAWVNSDCKKRKRRITKWKSLAHSGTRTPDPGITSLVPNPLGHQIWYINDNLKLLN